PPSPQDPVGRRTRLVLAGLAIGMALALAGRAAHRRPRLRVILSGAMGLIGLVLGALGDTLVLRRLSGNHHAAWRNENIFQLPPWGVVLPALVAGVAAGRPGATRVAFWIAAAAAALAGVGLLLKTTPWFRQDNLP